VKKTKSKDFWYTSLNTKNTQGSQNKMNKTVDIRIFNANNFSKEQQKRMKNRMRRSVSKKRKMTINTGIAIVSCSKNTIITMS
jgi:F0F1-type ATP synthase delta subunit